MATSLFSGILFCIFWFLGSLYITIMPTHTLSGVAYSLAVFYFWAPVISPLSLYTLYRGVAQQPSWVDF